MNSTLIIKFCFINLLILFTLKSYRLQGVKAVNTIINSDYQLSYSTISSRDNLVSGVILSPDGLEYYILNKEDGEDILYFANKDLSLGIKSNLEVKDMNYYIDNTLYNFSTSKYIEKDVNEYINDVDSVRNVMLNNLKNLENYEYILKENYEFNEILSSELSNVYYKNSIITTTSGSYFKINDNLYYNIASNSFIDSLSTKNSIVYVTKDYSDDFKNLAYGELTIKDVPTVPINLSNGRVLISNESAATTKYNEKNISKLSTSGSKYNYDKTPIDSILCVKTKYGFLYLKTRYDYFWIREKSSSSNLIIGENIFTAEKFKFTIEDKFQTKMFVVKEPTGMYFWEYMN